MSEKVMQRARALADALGWVAVDLDSPPDEIRQRSDFATATLLQPHSVLAYAADGGDVEVLWDARAAGRCAPIFLDEKVLIGLSARGIHGFPIAVGSRVFVELSELRARQQARAYVEGAAAAAALSADELERAVAETAAELLARGIPDAVTVTAGMLERMQEAGAALVSNDVRDRDLTAVAIMVALHVSPSRTFHQAGDAEFDEPALDGSELAVAAATEVNPARIYRRALAEAARLSGRSERALAAFLGRDGALLDESNWAARQLDKNFFVVAADDIEAESPAAGALTIELRSVWCGIARCEPEGSLDTSRLFALRIRACRRTQGPRDGGSPVFVSTQWETLGHASSEDHVMRLHRHHLAALQRPEAMSLLERLAHVFRAAEQAALDATNGVDRKGQN